MNTDLQKKYIAIIIIATLTSFFPTIRNGFTNWDDGYYLVNNTDIVSLSFEHIVKMFSSFYVAQYVPLVVLSFALEFRFFGLDPFVIHFTSLFLHLVTTVLVFSVVKKWNFSDEIAFLAALLFGIHPLHVEAVAWVSARKDTLSGVFLISSLLAFYRYEENNKRSYYILSLALYLCALGSKATMMFLPFFIVAQAFFTGKMTKKLFRNMIPFFISSIVFSGLVIYSLRSAGGLHLGKKYSILETVSIACYDIIFYICKTVFPVRLSSVYPFPAKVDGMLPIEFTIAVVLVVAAIMGIFYFRKVLQSVIVPLLFFIFGLIPTLQFVSFGSMFAADRFMYLSLIGILVVFIAAGDHYVRPRFGNSNIPKITVAIVVIVFSVLTWNRLSVWKNSETLWTDAISNYPAFPISYFSRGQYYFSQNKYDKALSDFNTAIELAPFYPHALNMRGYLLAIKGDKKKARKDFDNVIGLLPSHSIAHYNRGLLFIEENKQDSAFADFTNAIRYDSTFIEAYIRRGVLLMSQKKYREAIRDFSTVLTEQPDNILALVSRGTAALKLSLFDDAKIDLCRALVIDPGKKETNLTLSVYYEAIGKKDSAQYYFEKADEPGR